MCVKILKEHRMAKKDKKETASVLAFEKKLVPSDARMFGTTWDGRKQNAAPLKLQEKSVRGTISNRLKKDIANDPMKLNEKIENANLQTVDHCSLGPEQDTLKLCFTLKVLGGIKKPSACNNATFLQGYAKTVGQYVEKYEFKELAKRYATNIANARFLWRNRVGAEHLEVLVKILNQSEEEEYTFDASEIGLKKFDSESEGLNKIAKKMAQVLSDKRDFLLLEITAFARVGKAQEVYPSEELVLDKGKKEKSKILYHVEEQAAMHSQKIGNALRTIDTWYPQFSEVDTGPIAVDPYGAVTNLGVAYRNPKDKVDFYTLFDKYARGEQLENTDEEHFVMATLVRGGVFGESGKG